MFTNVHLALEARKMKRPGRAMQEREHSLLVGDGAAERGQRRQGADKRQLCSRDDKCKTKAKLNTNP